MTWITFSICFLDAISGTTPPYTVCSAIWEYITLDNTSLPFLTTAAAVSSQELSIARIVTSFSICISSLIIIGIICQLKAINLPMPLLILPQKEYLLYRAK